MRRFAALAATVAVAIPADTALSERDTIKRAVGRNAATPPAIRKDAGSGSRSLSTATATLEARADKQRHTLHRWEGTLRFFVRRPWMLIHGNPRNQQTARRELHRARVWVPILRRELGETRAALEQRRQAAMSPREAICAVFGPYCSQALRVVACETGGTFSVYASNHGAYLGLFQFGAYARARYGFGWDALTQSRAAYRYFVDSGRDWSPWECRP